MKDIVFHQFLKPISEKLITECTRRFQSDYDCEKFKTFDHLKTMIYAHIHEIKSLRVLEVAINSHSLDISTVSRSTLSDANKRRHSDCFLWILEQLLCLLPRKIKKETNSIVRLLDSSPIQLRGRGYDKWTKEYATRRHQGLKLHAEYDLELRSPAKIDFSYANYNDCNMGQRWDILKDVIYVFDKGYTDFNWWWKIHLNGSFFVTRLKRNTAIERVKKEITESDLILEDGTFTFKNRNPRGGKINSYTDELRRVCVKREGKETLVLVTNLMELPAETIADLYKSRWEIELFFKWIKQNLKLKKYLGRTSNAVKIQIITAIIAYLLIQIFRKIFQPERTLQLSLTWVKHNLHIEMPDIEASPPEYNFPRRAVFL